MAQVEPVPIHEKVVEKNGIMTIAFVRFLNNLRASNNTSGGDLTAIQKELDDTQTGAGLNNNGTYNANTTANYIKSATSLADADDKLDESIACKIINITTSHSASSLIDQNLLCDASAGNLNITLPNPSLYFNSTLSTSKKIAITKIDISSNIINILPFGSELIVGESSQDLQLDGEVLNFITDGTNWYLQN